MFFVLISMVNITVKGCLSEIEAGAAGSLQVVLHQYWPHEMPACGSCICITVSNESLCTKPFILLFPHSCPHRLCLVKELYSIDNSAILKKKTTLEVKHSAQGKRHTQVPAPGSPSPRSGRGGTNGDQGGCVLRHPHPEPDLHHYFKGICCTVEHTVFG